MRVPARALLWVGLSAALLARPANAHADDHSPAVSPVPVVGTPEAVAAARVHFTKGRALYQQGAYREAIVELDAARALDPKAKDLVFNLGVVHEKLGEIDDALRYARLYAEMDLEPAERQRAESYIKRLEGAKSEVDARRAAAPTVEPATPNETKRVRGRLDVATVSVGVIAVAAAGAGVFFGVKALGDKPSSGYVTGLDGTYAQLQSNQNTAHTESIVADACFGGAIAAAIVTAGLYFGRFHDEAPAATGEPPKQARRFTVTPLASQTSGGLLLGGAF